MNHFLKAIEEAEVKLEREPTCHEIYAEISNSHPMLPIHDGFHAEAILYSLLREDKVFTDPECSKFTLTEKEGFQSYS